jgi:hypothetical protein
VSVNTEPRAVAQIGEAEGGQLTWMGRIDRIFDFLILFILSIHVKFFFRDSHPLAVPKWQKARP